MPSFSQQESVNRKLDLVVSTTTTATIENLNVMQIENILNFLSTTRSISLSSSLCHMKRQKETISLIKVHPTPNPMPMGKEFEVEVEAEVEAEEEEGTPVDPATNHLPTRSTTSFGC